MPAHVAADTPLTVVATGRDHRWHFTYPGADGAVGTADDRSATGDLHVPAGTSVRLELHSDDLLYFFGVPQLDLRQVAMPDMTFELEFHTAASGRFDLLGDQGCGGGYPEMRGQLVIDAQPAFDTWLAAQTPAPTPDAQHGPETRAPLARMEILR